MALPKTLLQLSGADLEPAKLSDASLVLIDFQNEYLEGPLVLPKARAAISQAADLLNAARAVGAPVVHIAHKGRPEGLFDRDADRGQIVSELTPNPGEEVIEKGLPNAFANTTLSSLLAASERKDVIVAGFMTHMCVSSTARAALDLGHRVTIAGGGCATRDLPDGQGGIVDAETLHKVALIALSDRFAVIANEPWW